MSFFTCVFCAGEEDGDEAGEGEGEGEGGEGGEGEGRPSLSDAAALLNWGNAAALLNWA